MNGIVRRPYPSKIDRNFQMVIAVTCGEIKLFDLDKVALVHIILINAFQIKHLNYVAYFQSNGSFLYGSFAKLCVHLPHVVLHVLVLHE